MSLSSSQTYNSPGMSGVIRMDLSPMVMLKGEMRSSVTGRLLGTKTTKAGTGPNFRPYYPSSKERRRVEGLSEQQ